MLENLTAAHMARMECRRPPKERTRTHRTLRLCTWFGKLENPTQLASVFLMRGLPDPVTFGLISGLMSGLMSVAMVLYDGALGLWARSLTDPFWYSEYGAGEPDRWDAAECD